MPMGNSAGRSTGNRDGEGARRRGTDREREGIDPPFEPEVAPEPRLKLTPRGHRVLDWLAWTIWLVACVMLALLLGGWFGLVEPS